MPELPEIETVKLQLGKVLPGKKLVGVEVRNKRTVVGDLEKLVGLRVTEVRRKAKVLLMDFEHDMTMAFHFKMSGQLIFDQDEQGETVEDRIVGGHPTVDFVSKLPSPHTRVIFKFEHGVMFFNDQRMFGWVKVGKRVDIEKEKFFENLGPEPLVMTESEFRERIRGGKRPIKLVLMDQSVISGVGNIYANDALWEAKVDPKRPANTLTAKQYSDLFAGVKKVLEEGIKYGGATAADAKYIDLHGLGGHYQEHFRTYDQEDENCKRDDGGVIEKYVLGGRGTYVCPKCQE